MAKLYDYVVRVREQSRQAFCTACTDRFLLLHVETRPIIDNQWHFKTQTLSTTGTTLAQLMIKEGFRLAPEIANYHLFPVVKAMNNPWPERVSVGRARNNDIVLADSSVSKLHAHFISEGGRAFVCDTGSRNGTRVNDTRLAAEERYPVEPGDLLTFGGATVSYLDAGGLYDLVKDCIRPAS